MWSLVEAGCACVVVTRAAGDQDVMQTSCRCPCVMQAGHQGTQRDAEDAEYAADASDEREIDTDDRNNDDNDKEDREKIDVSCYDCTYIELRLDGCMMEL